MKKCGFTLAEVLITLGIVGVIAALTAPGLVMNSRNEANAAKLAVTISNLENALTSSIAQEGVDSLYRTQMWPAANLTSESDEDTIARFVGGLGKYLHTNGFVRYVDAANNRADVSSYYNGSGPYQMNANGSTGESSDAILNVFNNMFAVELKNGAILFMRVFANGDSNARGSQDDVAVLGGSLWSDAIDLLIDVNGKSGPNVIGRDIFLFEVGNNGILYPYGGVDVSIYEDGDRNHVWSNPANNSNTNCSNGRIVQGFGCAARLISEGYKMNY